LQRLDLERGAVRRYLGIIEARVRSRQKGAAWQRRYVAAHGRDMLSLTGAYVERQHSGIPVHEWDV